MLTALKWIGIVLGALVLAAALFLAFFDWNLLKGPIESLASNALGRPVEIEGDIDVDPSLTPRVTAHDIRVGNPDWADSPHLATLDRLEFGIRLPALLKGEVVLPELHLSKPNIVLERNAQGRANWDFQPDQSKDESQGLPPIPRIGDLSVEGGRLSYRDPNSEVHLNLPSTQGEVTGKDIEVHAEGKLDGRPLNLNLTAGGLSGLRGKDTAYPVDARLRLGEATATAQGAIERPAEGRGFDIDIEAQGPDLADLDPLAVGVSLARSPPFRLSGHLAGDVESPRLENPRLELGDNVLTGRIGLDRKGERPKLRADLSAPRLDVGELAGLARTGPNGAGEDFRQVPLDILSTEQAEATPYSGRFTGSADLAVQGNTPIEMAESARGKVVIDSGEFAYRTSDRRLDLDLGNAEVDLGPRNVALTAQGRLEGSPLSVNLDAGGLARLRDGERPYPLKGRIELGKTTATVEGTLAQPLAAAGPDLSVSVRGPSLGDLDPLIAGMDIPKTPPYQLSGQLTGHGERWALGNFRLGLGDSTVWGRVALDMGGRRPYVDADLNSPRLELGELRDIFGTGGKDEASGKGLFPDQAYDFKKLRTLDADPSLRSRNINAPELRLQELQAEARLDRGKLVVRPFKVGGGGEISGSLNVDARGRKTYTSLDADLKLLRLSPYAPETPFTDELTGTVAGMVHLYMVGDSPDKMAASANGTVTAIIEDGTISHLLLELIGLDVAQSLGVAITGDNRVPIRCMAADLAISDGVVRTQPVVFDTTDTKIVVDGRIDLGRETLDLRVIPRPKDVSLLSARSPILVQGPMADPTIRPDLSGLAVRGVVSAALGTLLSPLAAILPWIGPGTGENSPCRALITAGAVGD